MNDVCSAGGCSGTSVDADHDGYPSEACGGSDCDDTDPAVNPGAFEGPYGGDLCSDRLDNNCNGLIDSLDPGCGQCNTDSDCADGNPCNGSETCHAGACQPGTMLNCDDDNGCTDDYCSVTQGCLHSYNTAACDDGNECTEPDVCNGHGVCVPGPNVCPECHDADADGWGNPPSTACPHPELDCDDADPAVHPDAIELCADGIDNNCDGKTDAQDAIECEGNASSGCGCNSHDLPAASNTAWAVMVLLYNIFRRRRTSRGMP
jgi:hypothetical protein